VKIPDVNVLLYATNEDAQQHKTAREWLDRYLSGPEIIGFAWMTMLGFIRISTNPRASETPLTVEQALDQVDSWIQASGTTLLAPGGKHGYLLRQLLMEVGTAGNLTMDAHLAALAMEHGATLTTFDTDFHRFSGLKFEFLR
jgi:toxin-antitoxin system PIN domain toxin